MKFNFKLNLKFQFSSLTNKKVLNLKKKKILSRCQYQNKKALFTDSIFSEDFGQGGKTTRQQRRHKNIGLKKEYLRWRYILLVERSSWAHRHWEYIWIFRNCPDTIWWQKVSHPPGWRYNWIEYCGLLGQCQGCTLSSLSSHWQELQREIYSKMNLQGSHWPQCLLFSTTFKIG